MREVRTDLDFGGVAKATGLPSPTSSTDAATKGYVDGGARPFATPLRPLAGNEFPDLLHGAGLTFTEGATSTDVSGSGAMTKTVATFDSVTCRQVMNAAGAFRDNGIVVVGPTKYLVFGIGSNSSGAKAVRLLRFSLTGTYEADHGGGYFFLPSDNSAFFHVARSGGGLLFYYGFDGVAWAQHASVSLSVIGGSVSKLGYRYSGTGGDSVSFYRDTENEWIRGL